MMPTNLVKIDTLESFRFQVMFRRRVRCVLLEMDKKGQDNAEEMEYRNVATKVLSNFMNEKQGDVSSPDGMQSSGVVVNPINDIDFNAPKFNIKIDLETMASILDYELSQSEWFVTGKVNPIYFADNFQFQDPDVKLNGIEDYARGVNQLFDQTCSRAEIIQTFVNTEKENMITCQWRLSGKVKIGIGLTIKPYIVNTDFILDDTTGLIVFQEDRFDIPQWDILISALFPFLIGIVTSKPAPPILPRTVTKPVVLQ
jgi:hypothetical protein